MSSFRHSQNTDRDALKKLFQDVREGVEIRALFNWSDEMIEQELNLSSFYISETYEKNIEAFICYRELGDVVEILALGVQPLSRGRGVMQNLLSSFVQIFSKIKSLIVLEVHAANKNALKLYDRSGFKAQRVRKSYYQDGGDAVVMHLNY